MLRAEAQGAEDEEIQGALRQIERFGHGVVLRFYKSVSVLL
jgi:hypothetical protein